MNHPKDVVDRIEKRFLQICQESTSPTRELDFSKYLSVAIAEIMSVDRLISVDEVSAMTRLCIATIQRMSQQVWRERYNELSSAWRAFPNPVRIGRRIFYRKSEIEGWIDFCQSLESGAPKSRSKYPRKRKSPEQVAASIEAQIAGGGNAAI